jgi:Flp pilus assembly protein TadG
MTLRRGAPVGRRRPGHRCARVGSGGSERGSVTVEAALALLGMTVVLAAVVWAIGLLGAQLALGEAARAAARAAARSETAVEVVDEARRLVPDAAVRVSTEGEHLVVELRRVVRPPGMLARWGEVELSARAVAAAEQT